MSSPTIPFHPGLQTYPTSPIPLTSFLTRRYTPDRYVIPLLLLLIFTVSANLLTTILLRTRSRPGSRRRHTHFSSSALRTACQLSEIRSLQRPLPARFAPTVDEDEDHPSHKRLLRTGLVVLFLVAFSLAIDFSILFLSQPILKSSNRNQYGISGSQPFVADDAVSTTVQKLSRQRSCVTPTFTGEVQRRMFLISACFSYQDVNGLSSSEDFVQQISVTSFYHRAGSDHNITYGDSYHSLSIRVLLLPSSGDILRIRFENLDDGQMTTAKSLQESMVRTAINSACQQPFSNATCDELLQQLDLQSEQTVQTSLVLWEGTDSFVRENVRGVSSTFSINLQAPALAIRDGMRVLSSSSVLEEGHKTGAFIEESGRNVDGLTDLLTEEARLAGIVLLAIISGAMLFTLFVLRWIFRPVSVARFAWGFVEVRARYKRELVTDESLEEAFVDSYYYVQEEGSGGKVSAERMERIREGIREARQGPSLDSCDPSTEGTASQGG